MRPIGKARQDTACDYFKTAMAAIRCIATILKHPTGGPPSNSNSPFASVLAEVALGGNWRAPIRRRAPEARMRRFHTFARLA